MQSFKVFWENHNPLSRLYHRTGIESLIKILGSNVFKLTVANSAFERFIVDKRQKISNQKDPSYNYKKNYYISTARSMHNTYYGGNGYQRPFGIIELDASKLSDQYKIVPFNWHKNRDKWHEDLESEDRVLSKSSKIPNFLNYIKAFHINDYFNHEKIVDRLMTIKKVNQLIDSGKPVYMYNTINDLMILNRTKRKLLQSHIS